MADTPNMEVAKGFFDAQRGDSFEHAIVGYVHPNFRFVVSTANNDELRALIPWAGYEHKGCEGYKRLRALVFSEYQCLTFEVGRISDAGDQVFVEGHFRFRHRETAKITDSDFLVRFEMRDGMIVRGQMYENTAAVAEARRAD